MSTTDTGWQLHSAHWGLFHARMADGRLEVKPYAKDPDPNPVFENLPAALHHPARIARPMVRRGWLDRGPGADERRGRDEFVALPWDEVLDRLAAELTRVRDTHGAGAIFGGSYGWSSAGRFHHAQSQVHRFLNIALGGYVRSVNSYSAGASGVLLPYVMGPMEQMSRRTIAWEAVAQHSEVVLAFGGMALKNSMVGAGGISQHIERGAMQRAAARGARFVLIGPLAADLPDEAQAEWLSIVPNTDTALMLGIAHTLVADGTHDRTFIARYCAGWEKFEPYLMGSRDGQPKDAAWAGAICGVKAEHIVALARSLPGKRVLVTVAHSLQRAEHGEQPVWMGAVLAAMLGQIGLPGGGYGYALGALGHTGRHQNLASLPSLPQGRNGVGEFIPVARISDMLLGPGQPYEYNGQHRTYPDIRLVYWAGGNPFHHHQDLNRLRAAFRRPETVVVHESAWTASARHADIVLPATLTAERDDIGGSQVDPVVVAMRRIVPPYGEARDDYAIFSALAERLGRGAQFTEGRDVEGWLRHLYEPLRTQMAELGQPLPDFSTFWSQGEVELPQEADSGGWTAEFRADPEGAPLPTPTGKVEIFSESIAAFGYEDCPGHPAWLAPKDAPTEATPLILVANQPATKLHSQLDFGGHSAASKRRGREVMHIHPADAAPRGIEEGDIVRLFNDRGACLASASLTEGIRPGVVQLPTGAWYDPEDPEDDNPLCVHGNPNVLTRDVGTSRLSQGCTGQLTAVQVERFTGNLPPIRAFDPPG